MAAQCQCGRLARGFLYANPRVNNRIAPACSMDCLDTLVLVDGDVKKLNSDEVQAVAEASPIIGEWFDGKGTDMAEWSEETWLDFIGHVYAVTCDRAAAIYKRALTADDIPY